MTWVKLDDHFDEHPKIAALSDPAHRLWTNGLAYSNRSLSDGFIPAAMLRRLSTATKPDKYAAELVKMVLWHEVDGGWMIHDFHDYQPAKAQVLRDREANAKRQGRFRERKSNNPSNAVTESVTDAVSEGVRHPVGNGRPVPVPVPVTRYPLPEHPNVVAARSGRPRPEPPKAERVFGLGDAADDGNDGSINEHVPPSAARASPRSVLSPFPSESGADHDEDDDLDQSDFSPSENGAVPSVSPDTTDPLVREPKQNAAPLDREGWDDGLDEDTQNEWRHAYWDDPRHQEQFDRVFARYPKPGRKRIAQKLWREEIESMEWQDADIESFLSDQFEDILEAWEAEWEAEGDEADILYLSLYMNTGMWTDFPEEWRERRGIPDDEEEPVSAELVYADEPGF